MLRGELLAMVAARICALSLDHPVRVGIDGCDAAGKTTFADDLAVALSARRRPVIRSSIDGFHRPSSVRYRRGRDSAEGYFLDSFDNAALIEALLDPLGPGGSRAYRRAIGRAEVRDLELFGGAAEVRSRYERRYVPGQKLYFATCNPHLRTSMVIDNTNPSRPSITPRAREGE